MIPEGNPNDQQSWKLLLDCVRLSSRILMYFAMLQMSAMAIFLLGGFGSLSLSGIWQRSVGKQCMSCKLCRWLALTKLVVCKGPAT